MCESNLILSSGTNVSLTVGKVEEMEVSPGAQKDVPVNDNVSSTSKEVTQEDITNMLLNFEIKEVWLLTISPFSPDLGIILRLAV